MGCICELTLQLQVLKGSPQFALEASSFEPGVLFQAVQMLIFFNKYYFSIIKAGRRKKKLSQSITKTVAQ